MALLDSMGRRNNAADLTGLEVGRLTVISFAGSKKQKRRWLCLCICGKQITLPAYSVISKRPTLSCGCLHREIVSTHRLSYSAEYSVWKGIRRRCLNRKCKTYRFYGARGIQVCDRWRDSFENFIADVGMRPSQKHSIDRINNDGNYEPGNVRWATRKEQDGNTRGCKYVEFRGERLTISAWAKRMGVADRTMGIRLTRWGIERALTAPRPTSQFGNTRGEATGHAKLTVDKVLAIRRAAATGISYMELARQYDVTDGAIRAVVLRKNWKHVP